MRKFRLIACLVAALCLVATEAATAQNKDVSFTLDWLASGRHAGWFVALKKGFYADEGLNVTINRGFGSSDTITRLRAGQTDIVFSDIMSAILARARDDAPLKALAVIYAKHPASIFTHKSHNITSPQDLEGKRLADSAASTQVVLFEAYAQLAGIDPSKIEWVFVAPDAKMQVFLAGEVHGVGFYNMQLPLMESATADAGGVNMLEFGDFLDLYANGILTTDDFLAENADAALGFVQAAMRGWEYAFEHPDEAVELLMEEFPLLDPEVSKTELMIVKTMMESPESQEHGLGYMTEERMRETIETTLRLFEVEATLEPQDMYTNEYLPGS